MNDPIYILWTWILCIWHEKGRTLIKFRIVCCRSHRFKSINHIFTPPWFISDLFTFKERSGGCIFIGRHLGSAGVEIILKNELQDISSQGGSNYLYELLWMIGRGKGEKGRPKPGECVFLGRRRFGATFKNSSLTSAQPNFSEFKKRDVWS